MDAARALLGVSPSIAPVSVRSEPLVDSSLTLGAPALASEGKEAQPEKRSMQQESSSLLSLERLCGLPAQSRTSLEQVPEEYPLRPAARNLDALAALASTEQAKINSPSPFLVQSCGFSSSSDDDSETMPPPPPRGRRRSASNPEGMDKWDSLNRNRSARQHFVLPASILEEELAEVSEAVRERAERKYSEEYYDVSPDSVTDAEQATRAEKDDSNLTPDELLRRARSRLLEDLSEGTMNGEKGELVLPHNLSKYKEVRFTCCSSNRERIGRSNLTLFASIFLRYRSTTRMAASGFTYRQSDTLLSHGTTASARDECGTRRSDTTAGRVLLIAVFV
jgi:hypothetical protein